MKITLYWSEWSNRIFYVRNKNVYTIDGVLSYVSVDFLKESRFIHKIGEI